MYIEEAELYRVEGIICLLYLYFYTSTLILSYVHISNYSICQYFDISRCIERQCWSRCRVEMVYGSYLRHETWRCLLGCKVRTHSCSTYIYFLCTITVLRILKSSKSAVILFMFLHSVLFINVSIFLSRIYN